MSYEKFAVFILSTFWVLSWTEEISSREGKQESLEVACLQCRVFPWIFYFGSSFLQSNAIRRMGKTSDNPGSRVSKRSSGSGKIIQRPVAPTDPWHKTISRSVLQDTHAMVSVMCSWKSCSLSQWWYSISKGCILQYSSSPLLS